MKVSRARDYGLSVTFIEGTRWVRPRSCMPTLNADNHQKNRTEPSRLMQRHVHRQVNGVTSRASPRVSPRSIVTTAVASPSRCSLGGVVQVRRANSSVPRLLQYVTFTSHDGTMASNDLCLKQLLYLPVLSEQVLYEAPSSVTPGRG